MSKVSDRVKEYLAGGEDDSENISQTVTITLRGRAQLAALSQIAKRSKTRTASQILMDALQDAIDALPDEPIIYGHFYCDPEPHPVPYKPRAYVEAFIDDSRYHAQLEAQGFLEGERLYTLEEVEKRFGKQVEEED